LKTGTSAFRLLDPTAATTLDLTGVTGQNSSLTPGNSARLLKFTGTAGTRLFFNWQSPSDGNGYYQIFGVDNNPLNGNSGYSNYKSYDHRLDITLTVD